MIYWGIGIIVLMIGTFGLVWWLTRNKKLHKIKNRIETAKTMYDFPVPPNYEEEPVDQEMYDQIVRDCCKSGPPIDNELTRLMKKCDIEYGFNNEYVRIIPNTKVEENK